MEETLLKEIRDYLKSLVEIQSRTLRVLTQYDNEYHEEIERGRTTDIPK